MCWTVNWEVGDWNPCQGRSRIRDLELLHLHPLFNSSVTSTLTEHCRWEDEKARERTGHPTLYAKAEKMRLLSLLTRDCLKASLRYCSSISYLCELAATEDPPEYRYLYLIPAGSFIGGYALATQGNFPDVHQMTYMAASLCCVGALTGLSSQKTCRIGNVLGMIGVSSGIAATLGIVKPTNEVLMQMIACMGSGNCSFI